MHEAGANIRMTTWSRRGVLVTRLLAPLVLITITYPALAQEPFVASVRGDDRQGSAVLVHLQGQQATFVTCCHVVAGAGEVSVWDETRRLHAADRPPQVMADPDHDLALLLVTLSDPAVPGPVARLGTPTRGASARLIGFPAYLAGTRRVSLAPATVQDQAPIEDQLAAFRAQRGSILSNLFGDSPPRPPRGLQVVFVTSAESATGMSGGAAIDATTGDLVGIVWARRTDEVSLAIPSAEVTALLGRPKTFVASAPPVGDDHWLGAVLGSLQSSLAPSAAAEDVFRWDTAEEWRSFLIDPSSAMARFQGIHLDLPPDTTAVTISTDHGSEPLDLWVNGREVAAVTTASQIFDDFVCGENLVIASTASETSARSGGPELGTLLRSRTLAFTIRAQRPAPAPIAAYRIVRTLPAAFEGYGVFVTIAWDGPEAATTAATAAPPHVRLEVRLEPILEFLRSRLDSARLADVMPALGQRLEGTLELSSVDPTRAPLRASAVGGASAILALEGVASVTTIRATEMWAGLVPRTPLRMRAEGLVKLQLVRDRNGELWLASRMLHMKTDQSIRVPLIQPRDPTGGGLAVDLDLTPAFHLGLAQWIGNVVLDSRHPRVIAVEEILESLGVPRDVAVRGLLLDDARFVQSGGATNLVVTWRDPAAEEGGALPTTDSSKHMVSVSLSRCPARRDLLSALRGSILKNNGDDAFWSEVNELGAIVLGAGVSRGSMGVEGPKLTVSLREAGEPRPLLEATIERVGPN